MTLDEIVKLINLIWMICLPIMLIKSRLIKRETYANHVLWAISNSNGYLKSFRGFNTLNGANDSMKKLNTITVILDQINTINTSNIRKHQFKSLTEISKIVYSLELYIVDMAYYQNQFESKFVPIYMQSLIERLNNDIHKILQLVEQLEPKLSQNSLEIIKIQKDTY